MQCALWEFRCRLTLSNRHLFSLMAPRQPRKPVTMMTEPTVMTRLAAEMEGKEGEKVAKLPWETDSHMPTPNNPQPDNWGETDSGERFTLINTQKLIHYGSNIQLDSVSSGFYVSQNVKLTLRIHSLKSVGLRRTWEALSEPRFTQGKVYLLFQDWGRYVCARLANKTIPVSALPAVRAI